MNFKLTEDDRNRIAEYLAAMKEREQRIIDGANELGEQLNSTLVGICGHLTGSGAREYGVYKENGTEEYFIVLGHKDDKGTVAQPSLEKGGYFIEVIDPEDVFGRKMKTIEEWLNDD